MSTKPNTDTKTTKTASKEAQEIVGQLFSLSEWACISLSNFLKLDKDGNYVLPVGIRQVEVDGETKAVPYVENRAEFEEMIVRFSAWLSKYKEVKRDTHHHMSPYKSISLDS